MRRSSRGIIALVAALVGSASLVVAATLALAAG
jgi:hypothetical protein